MKEGITGRTIIVLVVSYILQWWFLAFTGYVNPALPLSPWLVLAGLGVFTIASTIAHAKDEAAMTRYSHRTITAIRFLIAGVSAVPIIYYTDIPTTLLFAYYISGFHAVFNIARNYFIPTNKWYYLGDTAELDKAFGGAVNSPTENIIIHIVGILVFLAINCALFYLLTYGTTYSI